MLVASAEDRRGEREREHAQQVQVTGAVGVADGVIDEGGLAVPQVVL
jgi:hypothetical protein